MVEVPTRTLNIYTAIPETSIGPYKLIRKLGEGGMGVVFHAQQRQPIRRDLALKVMGPGTGNGVCCRRVG